VDATYDAAKIAWSAGVRTVTSITAREPTAPRVSTASVRLPPGSPCSAVRCVLKEIAQGHIRSCLGAADPGDQIRLYCLSGGTGSDGKSINANAFPKAPGATGPAF